MDKNWVDWCGRLVSVSLSILRQYSIPEVFNVVLKYRVLWYHIAHHWNVSTGPLIYKQ